MKIRLTYAPENDAPQSWDWDLEDADNLEAEAIELVGGEAWDSYGYWFVLMGRGNMRAIRALLWVLLRRNHPDLDFNQVRFRTTEIAVEEIQEESAGGKDEPGDTGTGSPPPNTASAA